MNKQVCDRCNKNKFDPLHYKMCYQCSQKYILPCSCSAKKMYDSSLYKSCYTCATKNKPKKMNIDNLELLPDD